MTYQHRLLLATSAFGTERTFPFADVKTAII
ncbi:Uncharacterised protein [Klebsiella variicola]|nr:Uncharacterised protein [Klebsiella variicola]SXG08310.1 Uncharacterised protein [Klebsiella variicola]